MAEEPIFVDDSHERTLPVFTDVERPIVERFPELRPMAGMTVGHICGLLVALGEYSRIGYQAAYWIDRPSGRLDASGCDSTARPATPLSCEPSPVPFLSSP